MKKLTINRKPIAVWMETQADVDRALSVYGENCNRDYVKAKDVEAVKTAIACGLVPVFHCPIDDVENGLFPYQQPVLFCISIHQPRAQGGENPLKQKLYRWRLVYTGLVAFGESPNLASGERTVWGIPHHHSANFAEFGYS